MGTRKHHVPAFFFVVLLGLACLSSCAKNLVTKHRQFKLIGEKTEIAIGKKAKEDIIKEYGS